MTIPLATDLDDAIAAALGNPGLATWGALLGRANLQAGEGVLVNGATGIAGKQAIQVAKYLGASRIIATGRDEQSPCRTRCSGRGRDHLAAPAGREPVAQFPLGAGVQVQVVLDYLWGPSAELILKAAAAHGSPQGEPRIRFVQIGSISANAINLPAQQLRSSGVELIGSGLGSLSAKQIRQSLTTMFAAVSKVRFAIDIQAVPLARVEEAWTWKDDGRRMVFIP